MDSQHTIITVPHITIHILPITTILIITIGIVHIMIILTDHFMIFHCQEVESFENDRLYRSILKTTLFRFVQLV